MPELDISKEINIAIKAALLAGKHLIENMLDLLSKNQKTFGVYLNAEMLIGRVVTYI